MNAPESPAIITIREVYDEVMAVKSSLASQNVGALQRDVEDHEARIRSLEKWVWRASGLAALAGAGLSQVLGQV